MAAIPYDLIFEILSYLPSKTLMRFRTVSKKFNSLITDPRFSRLHHRRSRDRLFALSAISKHRGSDSLDLRIFLTDENNETIHEFTRCFYKDRVNRIIGSNHQLLCFVLDNSLSLYDPINRDFLELPSPSPRRVRSPHSVSFGFVDSTMQYKVIRWYLSHGSNLVFEVLTLTVTRGCRLEISPWRLSEKHCPYLLRHSSPPVHVDEYVYWRSYDSQIVSFSLPDETFSVLSRPPCLSTKNQRLENVREFMLYGIRGKLWLVDCDNLEQAVDIWTRSDERSSNWIKVHRVGVFSERLAYTRSPFEMLDIHRDFVLFRLLHPNVVMYYDAREKTTRGTEELRGELQLCHYVDGLLSLKNVFYS
ncbi:PREDICTED: F-box protein At3g07870-like [Tarenaya hassleriana]|uniref:F-box protein At3g07870-like n=1 Tax=Tarenaya hassleriana TaxID=28532 RepID=UPI00053C87F7|nr:PREDICTED: F-box protein At3g07870-like [Tarenaya hassleriana]